MYLLHISCALVFVSAPSEIFLLLMLPIHMVVLLTCSKLLTRHSANKVKKKKSTSFHSVLLQPYNRSNVPPRQEARDILFFFFCLWKKTSVTFQLHLFKQAFICVSERAFSLLHYESKKVCELKRVHLLACHDLQGVNCQFTQW